MEHSYVGDLIPSINSYQKIIDQYERGLKKGEFYEEQIGISGLFLISTITVVEANLAFKKSLKIASIKKEESKTPIKKGWFK